MLFTGAIVIVFRLVCRLFLVCLIKKIFRVDVDCRVVLPACTGQLSALLYGIAARVVKARTQRRN